MIGLRFGKEEPSDQGRGNLSKKDCTTRFEEGDRATEKAWKETIHSEKTERWASVSLLCMAGCRDGGSNQEEARLSPGKSTQGGRWKANGETDGQPEI